MVSRAPRRDPELRELEAQVEAFQREAAQHRAEAERAFDEMTRQLWTRLAEPDRSTRVVVAPVPPRPELSEPPPTAPASPPEPPPPASAPDAPSPARPTSLLPLPALTPAPWVLWAEAGLEAGDGRAPERVVADVHEAVVTALETHAHLLSSLGPEESVSVVMDFVAGTPFLDEGARARRSLTLKVRKRDLDERVAGRLSAEELRRRVEAVEY
jgi:hypothetical protein